MSFVRVERPMLSPAHGELVVTRRCRLPRPALSIRLRLTLLYSAILALALTLFGAALYITSANIVLDEAKQALTTEAKAFNAALHIEQSGIVRPPSGVITDPHTYIQIRNLDGTVVPLQPGSQATSITLPFITAAEQQSVLQGEDVPVHTVTIGGEQMLLYSVPIVPYFAQRVVGIVQVARPLQDAYGPLDTLRPVLFLGGVLATLLAFGAGWLLAGTALRPIARITRTARDIGEARDFGRRVAYSGPPDEVGRLATTFNTMLVGLQEAYQVQRRFVADASHELRTPLTSIRGNLGLLQREPPISDVDRHEVLADLASESERLSRLVSDLLTLARTDAGRQLRRESVLVAPLLADLSRRLAASYPGRPIRCEGGDGVAVEGEPDALTQVLLILLDNALKFTPPDGQVSVVTTLMDGRVSIAVRDTGPGIAPEALPRVFERFYQGDAARAGTGTGLGLSIAKALVEALHGTISLESEPGCGSAFTVTLPTAPAVASPAPPTPLHAAVS